MLEHDFTTYNNFIIPAFLEPELIGTLLSSYNLENGKKLYVLLSTGDKVINLVQTTLANGYKQNRLSINKEGMLKVEIVDTQISLREMINLKELLLVMEKNFFIL